MLSVLVVGAVVGVGFSAFCVCDDAVAAAFNGGLAPGDGEDRLDFRIDDEDAIDYRIDDEDAIDYRIDDEDRLEADPDHVESGLGSAQSALMASYYAVSW